MEVAYTLAVTDSEETDLTGLLHLVKFYKSRRFVPDIGLPRPNDFCDIPEYFVLEELLAFCERIGTVNTGLSECLERNRYVQTTSHLNLLGKKDEGDQVHYMSAKCRETG
ncbi:uncharacterized protein LOC144573397 isoform X2 [Carex rostrata]